ncbi:MAG: ATP-binding protein, partial [Pseudomonadota bacterium]
SATGVSFTRDQREIVKAIIDIEALVAGRGPRADAATLNNHVVAVSQRLETIQQKLDTADYPLIDAGQFDELRLSYEQLQLAVGEFLARERSLAERRAELVRRRDAFAVKVDEIETSARDIPATVVADAGYQQLLQRVSDVRFSASTLLLRIDEALLADDDVDLGRTEAAFAKTLRSTIFQLSLLPDTPMRRELAQGLRELFEWGRGRDHVFHQQRDWLGLAEDHVGQQEQIRLLLQQMFDEVDALTALSNELLRESLASANRALSNSLAAVLVAGAISVLIALFMLLRYVRPIIIRRLERLRETTARLTAGDLDAGVDPVGNDEITDLERAIGEFRDNAIVLRERDRAVAAHSEELEQVNKELDNFAYVASHDLRAPLRAVDNLAAFLQEDLGDGLPEQSARHLSLMRSRIARLDLLLTGLLEYSRVGRTDQAVSVVELRPLIERSAELMVPESFSLDMLGDFPRVRTRAIPLEQIVRNLVDNSIKHHDRDEGHIVIRGELQGDLFELAVTDDGPGIPTKYHERVFGMFETLKARDEVEGSGMGLAILKKRVETHGGSIALDSDPERGRGTTFTVLWPVTVVVKPAPSEQPAEEPAAYGSGAA